MSGKGSRPRPRSREVSDDHVAAEYARLFGKGEPRGEPEPRADEQQEDQA